MDNEDFYIDITRRKLPGLAGEYANLGIKKFQNKDYKGAKENFKKSMLISQIGGKVDTMVLYNTALASEYSEDFESAKESYDKLIELKYNADGAGADLLRDGADERRHAPAPRLRPVRGAHAADGDAAAGDPGRRRVDPAQSRRRRRCRRVPTDRASRAPGACRRIDVVPQGRQTGGRTPGRATSPAAARARPPPDPD